MNKPSTPFNASGQPEPQEVLPANGAGKTILCDCNGTLFDAAHRRGLNMEVFDFLIAAEQRGYNVVLHSGSPDDNISGYMAIWMMRHARFKVFVEDRIARNPDEPEILHKNETYEWTPFLTIDDEHGGGYTSKAQHQWDPNDARMAATMLAWGEPPKSAAIPAAGVKTPRTP